MYEPLKPKGTLDDFVSKKELHRRENEKLKALVEKNSFEKNDAKALIIAALTTLVPVVLIGYLFFYFGLKFLFKF